jgi:hypothetical protein
MKPASFSKALWIPRILFFLSSPLFFFALSLSLLAFDPAFYYSMQSEIGYPVNQETRAIDEKLAQFFWSGEGLDSLSGFQEKEILHLYDIRGLLRSLFCFTLGSGGFFIASALVLCFLDPKFRRIMKWGLIFTYGIYLLAGVLLYFFFDWFFLHFHLWTFANNYWILGENYLLFRLFPPQLFQASLLPFFMLLVFLSGLFFLLVFGLLRKSARKERAS